MGLFSFLRGGTKNKTDENERDNSTKKIMEDFPELYNGIPLDVMLQDGKALLSGKLTSFSKDSLTVERMPGQLSFPTCEVGTVVNVRGFNSGTMPFELRATVEESTRIVLRLKDLQVIPYDEHRANFRLSLNIPMNLYYQHDEHLQNPEECILVNISTGGACIKSEFLHAEGEILRMRAQIDEYAPISYLGQIIRVEEPEPGKFQYGFLFAQLDENEITALTKILYNVQVGNKRPWSRNSDGPGYWG